jgi:hypothetical protein
LRGTRRWGNTNLDVLAAQKQVQAMDLPAYPLEVARPAAAAELDAQEAYFRENSEQILADLEKHGAVVMRGFELMKTPGALPASVRTRPRSTPCCSADVLTAACRAMPSAARGAPLRAHERAHGRAPRR